MARPKKTEATQPSQAREVSVAEIAQRESVDFEKRQSESFRRTKNKIQYLNLKDWDYKSSRTYDKEKLRRYIKNPERNFIELQELSRYLYRLSYPYRRIIQYNATMLDMTSFICVPDVDMQHANSKKVVKKHYEKALKQIQKMNMKSQIVKLLTIAWREDAVFAYAYEDSEAFFLLPLDGDYCRIVSQNFDGTYNFAFDFGYFDTYPYLLEYWDKEFKEKYELYTSDKRLYRWQVIDADRGFCLKINQDHLWCLPPFLPLFQGIIDLIDLQDIQNVKDKLSIYKLLIMREETLQKATQPDEFTVDIDSAVAYFDKFAASLPPEVAAVLSLLPVDVVEFKGDTTDDVDMISNSMSNLFKSAGVSQILDRNKIEGAVAFTAAMISDSVISTASILPQVEVWINRYIQFKLGHCAAKIKYLPVTPYTKADYLNRVLAAAQSGAPVKLQISSLLNEDPFEAYSMQYLENEVLDIATGGWIPLSTSYTLSGTAGENGQTATVENPDGAGRPATTGDNVGTSTSTETTTTKTSTTTGGSSSSSSSTRSTTTVG